MQLPFYRSNTTIVALFQLIHCDLWTSPVLSNSGYHYYLVVLDDFSYYLWAFPLRRKSKVFSILSSFYYYVQIQFLLSLQSIQADNGLEFNNISLHNFSSCGIHLHFSCPYTSQQNGKAERMIHTINNVIRSLLSQAHMPPLYCVEALSTATYLLNRCPC